MELLFDVILSSVEFPRDAAAADDKQLDAKDKANGYGGG